MARSKALVALAVLACLLVGGFAAPTTASAAPLRHLSTATSTTNYQIRLDTTGLCLSSDYANVYTVPCASAGTWHVIYLGFGDGDYDYYLLQANNTGLCLSNFNYDTVYPAGCDGNSGEWWGRNVGPYSSGVLPNWNTDKYLASDYSQGVYLINYNAGETWTFYPAF